LLLRRPFAKAGDAGGVTQFAKKEEEEEEEKKNTFPEGKEKEGRKKEEVSRLTMLLDVLLAGGFSPLPPLLLFPNEKVAQNAGNCRVGGRD
jgi:hypothetical protein